MNSKSKVFNEINSLLDNSYELSSIYGISIHNGLITDNVENREFSSIMEWIDFYFDNNQEYSYFEPFENSYEFID